MRFQVHLTRAAEKDLDRLGSDAERLQVIAALRNLESNPYAGQVLTGDLTGFYSLHLTLPSGQARVIYTIYHEHLVILVVALGMRESIYRKASAGRNQEKIIPDAGVPRRRSRRGSARAWPSSSPRERGEGTPW